MPTFFCSACRSRLCSLVLFSNFRFILFSFLTLLLLCIFPPPFSQGLLYRVFIWLGPDHLTSTSATTIIDPRQTDLCALTKGKGCSFTLKNGGMFWGEAIKVEEKKHYSTLWQIPDNIVYIIYESVGSKVADEF